METEKIEEIAKVLHDRIINKTWRAKKVAKELYEIVVPDGAVVLTREGQERIEQRLAVVEKKADELKQVRKETAREILGKIIWFAVKRIGQTSGDSYYQISFDRLDELAKQFGVEIEG